MTVLHTIHNSTALSAALDRAGGGVILLLEDGVYLALKPLPRGEVLVLREDMASRGLTEDKLAEGVKAIGMSDFVALAAAHSPIVAWF